MRPTFRWGIQFTGVIVASLITVTGVHDVGAADNAAALRLLVESLNAVDDVEIRNALLQGMLKGLEGRRGVEAPPQWAAVVAKLDAQGNTRTRDLASQLSQIFGDKAAIERALAVVADVNASPEERKAQLTSLLARQNTEVVALLEGLLEVPELQLTAIRGYAAVEDASAPSVLLKRYPTMKDELRRAVIETLSARKLYADALLKAIQDKAISRADVPTHVARSLHTLLGSRFVEIFGEPPTLGADREKQIADWKKRITPEALADANATRGRVVYQKTCAACHQLYGVGGQIGPDLTGSNRANLDYLLLNSVDPSYDVPEAYKMISIVTTNGLVVNGVLAEEDGTRVVLKTVENPRLVIAKSDIERRVVSKKSMMPDGQLEALKPLEVIDLIKYLRTKEQVELPK